VDQLTRRTARISWLPSIHTEHAVELKEESLMCVSLETTIEVTDDQEKMNNFYQQNKLVQYH